MCIPQSNQQWTPGSNNGLIQVSRRVMQSVFHDTRSTCVADLTQRGGQRVMQPKGYAADAFCNNTPLRSKGVATLISLP